MSGVKTTMDNLVPKLRFLEFREAGAWGVQKIGQHLTESRVKGSKGDVAKKLTVKLWGNGVYGKQEAVQGSANTQYYHRKAGQFIYSKLDFLNQAFGIIPKHLDNYESTVDLPCFDASDELDLRFLLEYVQRKDFYKRYGEIADGGRKAKRIQVEMFLDFPIFLPKLDEQQKIADCLSSLDALIAAQSDKLDALKTHKKGLMQQLFPREGETVPRLRFAEFRGAGEWEVKQLGEISNIRTGPFGSVLHESDYVEFGTPIITVEHLGEFWIEGDNAPKITDSDKERLSPYVLSEGDIVFSRVGSVDRSAIIRDAEKGWLFSGRLLRLRVITKENFSAFLNQMLKHEPSKAQIRDNAVGQTMPSLNTEILKRISLSFPSLPE